MLTLEQIKNFYQPELWAHSGRRKYILKEYIQLLILEYLTTTPWLRQLVFIGGTNLRLVKGIDRFSEDLDFDCRGLMQDQFSKMAEGVVTFLNGMGLPAETRPHTGQHLTAFRWNIHFPGLLFSLGLSAYREERFLIKLEAEDQGIEYATRLGTVSGCGLFFKFPVPPDSVMCSMKISALLNRRKGRDFYDVMFLLSQTGPDYGFLSQRHGIANPKALKAALLEVTNAVDLSHKARDFEHLAFNPVRVKRILQFGDIIESLAW